MQSALQMQSQSLMKSFEAMLKSQAQDVQEFKRPKKQGGNDAEL